MRLFGRRRQTPEQHFHSSEYLRHNARRQEHLATLGLNLRDQSVLEVGAGIGDHTHFFLDRGCQVLCTEPREENLAAIRRRYRDDARVTVRQLDLDGDLPSDVPAHDIVYCYGTLYHLARPAEALAWLCARVKNVLLLETCVSLRDEGGANLVPEEKVLFSQAVTGTGCRPSRSWVMGQLSTLMPHAYMTRTQPWHAEFPLDWTVATPGNSTGLTRAVFVASRQPLDSALLSREVLMQQTRA